MRHHHIYTEYYYVAGTVLGASYRRVSERGPHLASWSSEQISEAAQNEGGSILLRT